MYHQHQFLEKNDILLCTNQIALHHEFQAKLHIAIYHEKHTHQIELY